MQNYVYDPLGTARYFIYGILSLSSFPAKSIDIENVNHILSGQIVKWIRKRFDFTTIRENTMMDDNMCLD